MIKQPPELVIFDCDGVLVDSEPISISTLLDFVRDAGVILSPETAYMRFLGRSMASIGSILKDEYGVTFTGDLLEEIRRRQFDRFRNELLPITGVKAALSGIRLKKCVASSSQPDRIRLSLELTGLLEFFGPNIYSSTMVRHGKPAPDLFLLAALRMGVAPENVLVIEDSPAGVVAAGKAGMRVFAYAGGSHIEPGGVRKELEKLAPEEIFDNMALLPELIAGPGA